ncbi:hypothetical protein [Caballeronia sp. GAOx1]|jgi:hypothetical protein|uniref:hypothetical protein n=1 Tax=Caballeronia sp. GAOx1 TaxID=2921761 RepID=UPI00202985DC|nr:hypothetical protein [Caballeronia sp. GAOx1]
MYDVTSQIKRGSNLGVLGRAGHSIQIHNGPFTCRWAYLIAASAGQAGVDALLDAQHKD